MTKGLGKDAESVLRLVYGGWPCEIAARKMANDIVEKAASSPQLPVAVVRGVKKLSASFGGMKHGRELQEQLNAAMAAAKADSLRIDKSRKRVRSQGKSSRPAFPTSLVSTEDLSELLANMDVDSKAAGKRLARLQLERFRELRFKSSLKKFLERIELGKRGDAARVYKCLHQLPKAKRDVLMWHLAHGLTFKEIADLLNIDSERLVRQMYERAVDELERSLKPKPRTRSSKVARRQD